MGVLPLQFLAGDTARLAGLDRQGELQHQRREGSGRIGRAGDASRRTAPDGAEKKFEVQVRVDTPAEADYYRNGGILPYVLRQLAAR